jgi:hypothetical protein
MPSASDVVCLLFIISRINYNKGSFPLSDPDMGRILSMSTTTVQRAKKKWAGWLTIRERRTIRGESGPKDSGEITEYLGLSCPGLDSKGQAIAKSSYLDMWRSTFVFLLKALQNKSIKHRHIVAFIGLLYLEWKDRGDRRKERPDFTVDKEKLRALFGMDNAPKLIMDLSQIPAKDGEPLFRVTDKYRKLEIAGLRKCPGPPLRPRSGGMQKSGD